MVFVKIEYIIKLEVTKLINKRKQKIRGQQISIKKKLLRKQNKPHCEYCGNDNKKILQIHHIKPVYLGGDNDVKNLIILCPNCHKSAHAGLIKTADLIRAKNNKKVFESPEQIQKNLDKLKQIQKNLAISIINNAIKNFELTGKNRDLKLHLLDHKLDIKGFKENHRDIKTKLQLCTYLNRIELKYQSLKNDYAKLELENERLKTNLKKFELSAQKPDSKEKRGIFHFLGAAFFGLS